MTVATSCDSRRSGLPSRDNWRLVEFNVSGNAHPRTRYKGETGKYRDFISAFQGDVIMCHAWQNWTTDIAVSAFPRVRAKKILISHGVSANSKLGWPRTLPYWFLWQWYLRVTMPRMLMAFDHVVFLHDGFDSDRAYDRRLVCRFNWSHTSIIPNGVDLLEIDSAPNDFRKRFGIGHRKLLLSVGAFSPLKNQAAALKSFGSVRIPDTTLVIIGQEKNRYYGKVERIARSFRSIRSSNDVLLLSNVDRNTVLSAFKAADLYLCTSLSEYFPVTILEAMASCTPYIAFNVGNISSLPGGIVVKDQHEMVRAIEELLARADLRHELAKDGRNACVATYNWPCITDKYEKLIKRLLG